LVYLPESPLFHIHRLLLFQYFAVILDLTQRSKLKDLIHLVAGYEILSFLGKCFLPAMDTSLLSSYHFLYFLVFLDLLVHVTSIVLSLAIENHYYKSEGMDYLD